MTTCKQCREFEKCKDDAFINGAKFDQNESVEYCTGFDPITNADRIRAMTDEELEKFINHFNICDMRTNDECKFSYCACCEVCVMDWLQQPAEGDA